MRPARPPLVSSPRRIGAAPHEALSVALRFDRFSVNDATADYVYALHQHPDYEWILVDRGRYDCTLNRARLTLRPGDVLLVKPGDWHQDFCVPPLRYFGIGFRFERGLGGTEPARLLASGLPEERQCARGLRAALWPTLRRILVEQEASGVVSDALCDAFLRELFWRLVRALPPDTLDASFLERSAERDFSARLYRLFQGHLHDDLRLPAMAAALSMSESSLAHKCKAILGASPAKAFMHYRMERARRLLEGTAMSVKEVAAYLGFDDPYHFSKAFKRHVGQPPTTCRRKGGPGDA